MINWSGISDSSLIGNFLRRLLNKLVPQGVILPILQGPAKGMKWITGQSVHGCWLGSYEAENQKTIVNYLKRGMIAYDLGAHVGFYTLMFSRLVGNTGKVFAFEPHAVNCYYLSKHISLNNIQNVVIEQCAVSDSNGFVLFYPQESSSMGKIIKDGENEFKESYKIPSISLDNFVFLKKNPAPHLIKMDIEGAEALALSGMQKILKEKKPILLIALHGVEVAQNCFFILERLHYKIKTLSGLELNSLDGQINEILCLPPGLH